MDDKITVKGARMHNLKDITVEMPRNKMIVITGLSGSGKSSLAFDTIFAEGQRRYVESLSSYARQFLNQMQKPDVDEITGLSPAISIDQKSRSNNPRSTVATITEIYDYLRILYARIGHPYSPINGRRIQKLTTAEIQEIIQEKISEHEKSDSITVYSPVVRGRKGEYYQLLYDLLSKGFSTVLVDGKEKSLREQIVLDKNKKHDIDVLVDEVTLEEFSEDTEAAEERLFEAIERALDEANGLLRIVFSSDSLDDGQDRYGELLSSTFTDPYSGYSFPEIEPRLFSFNSPYGACPECRGIGTKHVRGSEKCPLCKGARLREEALHVFLEGKDEKYNIVDVTNLTIKEAKEFFESLELSKKEKEISKMVVREITERLRFMLNVGIEYLTLSRRAHTLSGGEAQRIRLASQLGSGLVGALYVLDEPTIGLHPRDNERLVDTLHHLRDLGNTIVVVEHDEDTIAASDYLIDIGPGAGRHGGEVVAADWLEKLMDAKKVKNDSLTLKYLRGEEEVEVPQTRRKKDKGTLRIRSANRFNLKNIDVDIPLGRFVTITGVSGSGKSTLLYEVLNRNLRAKYTKKYRSKDLHNVAKFDGTEYLSRVVLVDQSPIGRTSRSNPATYTGAFDHIRDLFASTSEARARGWKRGRFSFNTKGGRCEACAGKGEVAVEMHFLPTVHVKCDICDGKRYTNETLEVKYDGKSIFDVLEMTIEEALEFFKDIPAIFDRLNTLNNVGLGYLQLGQSSTTLSGGEGQRVKISSELYRYHTQKTIYLLDEPTVGLHYEDVKKLVEILNKLIEQGNSVVVIEHNMDLIKSSDYVIDMGPEGGEGGGQIVATGTPEEVVKEEKSYTAKYLKRVL
ncbi:MAG: excinuclease ABC subunit UvrA [Candidatus Paceibacterota bacterium]